MRVSSKAPRLVCVRSGFCLKFTDGSYSSQLLGFAIIQGKFLAVSKSGSVYFTPIPLDRITNGIRQMKVFQHLSGPTYKTPEGKLLICDMITSPVIANVNVDEGVLHVTKSHNVYVTRAPTCVNRYA